MNSHLHLTKLAHAIVTNFQLSAASVVVVVAIECELDCVEAILERAVCGCLEHPDMVSRPPWDQELLACLSVHPSACAF